MLAADDPAGDLVRPSKQAGGLFDPAAAEEAADGTRADDPTVEDGRRYDVDGQAGPTAQDLKTSGVAEPVPAEPEAAADDDFPGAELRREDAVDESPAGEPGEGHVEGRDDDGVDAGISEPFQPLLRSVDHLDRPLVEGALRMGVER